MFRYQGQIIIRNNNKSEEYKEEEKQEEWEAPQGRIGREGAGQLKS